MPVYDYDLTSAFPSVARNLVDFRQCEWIESSEYQPGAVYGYVRCEVIIWDWIEISPILAEDSEGNLISPVGTWETYLTKGELEFIDKWDLGEYKIVKGYWAIPKAKPLDRPLDKPLDKLLTYKQKTGLQAALAKRMSVGFYGKFGEERKEEFGPYFNPVFFAEISTKVRLQVAEFLYEHGIGPTRSSKLLHVSIDGCLLSKEVDDLRDKGNGRWRLNSITPALIVSSGLVFYADKKPKGLGLDDMLVLIEEHPQSGYYEKKIKRRVTLGDALSQNFSDLGTEKDMTSSIDLVRIERDRKFKETPQTGQQLLSKKYTSKARKMT